VNRLQHTQMGVTKRLARTTVELDEYTSASPAAHLYILASYCPYSSPMLQNGPQIFEFDAYTKGISYHITQSFHRMYSAFLL
jgi:hypothetical protein